MHRIYSLKSKKTPLWVDLLLIFLGISGAIIFFLLYDRALPSASVDVSVTRAQVEEIASGYLQEFGYAPDNYKIVLSFSEDRSSLYYLQRTLGVEESNARMIEEEWPVYYWYVRWFKPLEKEEFRVYLKPNGEFLGFTHIIPEDALADELSQADASVLARNFLATYTNWQIESWQEIEASSKTQPGGRVDHLFTWRAKDFSAGSAEMHYSVTVHGDVIGNVDHWVKVPETFSRQFSQEREQANLINSIAYILGFLGFLVAALVGIGISRTDGKRAFGPALLVGGVSLAAALNYLSLYPLSYSTTQNYTLFWALSLLMIFFSALFPMGVVFVGLLGGQYLSRLVWPREDRVLVRGSERWLAFSLSAWRGIMFGGVHLAYVVSFYLLSSKYLGWWSPVRAEYSNIFSTPLPFLSALDAGLSAALTEEFLFRLVGISLFLWIFKKKYLWAAILIPGVLWAFAHSSYVTYPIYVRGIELIPVAILLGIIFTKFDLLTAIISHFTYNMIIVGVVLLRASEPYYFRSGLVVLFIIGLTLLPGLVWQTRSWFKKGEPQPDKLILTDATLEDVPMLATMPIKADWDTLLRQPDRVTLVLRAENSLVGMTTGTINEEYAMLDGVYVDPKWRRQFWASTMIDAIKEIVLQEHNIELRTVLYKDDTKAAEFLYGQQWRTKAQIITPGEAPVFSVIFKEGWHALLRSFKKKEPEPELEIPREEL